MKQVTRVHSAPPRHWVGDGFPVCSLFSYQGDGQELSPFLLLDYAGPADFSPSENQRGVGEHPHRGFETVTIVYSGEVEHLDSTGAGGKIGPGDVQWMTAASGILHQEFHSRDFTRDGGSLEMVQLWVNLPAKDKMSAPGYQSLLDADIPAVALPGDAGTVRIIAGEFSGKKGPARTHTPMHVWDLQLDAGGACNFDLVEGWTAALVVLRGTVEVNGKEIARASELVLLDRTGSSVGLVANNDARLLVLNGEPLNEPIVGYGPFVMNTEAEIRQAIADYNSGQFGRIPAESAEKGSE